MFLISGQEQDFSSQRGPEEPHACDLGQGDPNPRKRRIRPSQVRQEFASPGHGQEGQGHDVPGKEVKPLFTLVLSCLFLFVNK